MNDLIKLGLLWAEVNAMLRGRQTALRMACIAAIVGTTVAGLACALAALWIALSPLVGDAGAPLIVAGVLLAIGLAAFLLMRYADKPQRVDAATPGLLLAEVERLVKDHKGATLMATLVTGVVAGMSGK